MLKLRGNSPEQAVLRELQHCRVSPRGSMRSAAVGAAPRCHSGEKRKPVVLCGDTPNSRLLMFICKKGEE